MFKKEVENTNNHISACEELLKDALKRVNLTLKIDRTGKHYIINVYNDKKYQIGTQFFDVSSVLGFIYGIEYAKSIQ